MAEELHARFLVRDGVAVAQDYGDVEAEYDALRTSAGIVDLTYFKFLRVQGDDRVAWLHKLVAADVQALG
ncbi:MAG: aminomethyl transferase family protein, partial [Chloroflexi bacterium]|nr:aminomethyl transferase family protein [Chloroflexota bacterium]